MGGGWPARTGAVYGPPPFGRRGPRCVVRPLGPCPVDRWAWAWWLGARCVVHASGIVGRGWGGVASGAGYWVRWPWPVPRGPLRRGPAGRTGGRGRRVGARGPRFRRRPCGARGPSLRAAVYRLICPQLFSVSPVAVRLICPQLPQVNRGRKKARIVRAGWPVSAGLFVPRSAGASA